MRAIAIEHFGGTENLTEMDLPVPEPEAGEVRIRIAASGVNPVDWKIRAGMLKPFFPHRFPLILGWEAAGVIDATGAGADRFRRGDAVFAYTRKPEIHGGTYAEYVVVPESFVALMPRSLLFHEAASVPLAGLTAFQALFREPGVTEGATVLVHAASGGVGMFAAQLAKSAGATVLGTAGPTNQDFVRSLGVDHAIDYRAGDFREAVRAIAPGGVDVVMDCVGGEALEKSYDVVKAGGRLVSVVTPPDPAVAASRGMRAYYHFVEPSSRELAELGDRIDSRKVRTHVSAIFSLRDAALAHLKSHDGHTRGKSVLVL